MNIGLLLLLGFFILVILSVPIAFSLGLASVFVLLTVFPKPLFLVPQQMIIGTNKFALLAIPFFIFIGVLMEKGDISKSLIDLASKFVGFIRGGLAMVCVLASMFFGAISGSGPATVAAIGSITIPGMTRKGYSKEFATGIAAAAGTLGPIIPPSILMIVFGVVAQISITKLFLAGFGAGFLIGLVLMIVCYYKAVKENVPRAENIAKISEIFTALWEAKFVLGAPIIVLGGIYGGIFTPTEAGAIGAVYTLIIGIFFTRTLNFKIIVDSILNTAEISASILFIMANATLFSWLMSSGEVPQKVSAFILSISADKIIVLLIINIFLLMVGTVIDGISAVTILVPVLLPIAEQLGMDLTHFGIIVVVNLVIGFITPPLGVNLYVAVSTSGLTFEETIKGVIPFLIGAIICLIILTYVPAISMFIPNLFFD